jgi:hypothetical protein
MSSRDDGGPAFPMVNELGVIHHSGMTLRDWFAANAMSAMVTKHDGEYSSGDDARGVPKQNAVWFARAAYRLADAMLEARKK